MTTFYYLHGFLSGFDPNNEKVKLLESLTESPDAWKDDRVVGRTTNYLDPTDVDELDKEICRHASFLGRDLVLVGTSLGGYFARYFANKYSLQCILINPALYPENTLKRSLGEQKNYLTGETIYVNERAIDDLGRYRVDETPDCLTILAADDDVVDHRVALEQLKNAKIVLTEGGHRLNDLNKVRDDIATFLGYLPAHGFSNLPD